MRGGSTRRPNRPRPCDLSATPSTDGLGAKLRCDGPHRRSPCAQCQESHEDSRPCSEPDTPALADDRRLVRHGRRGRCLRPDVSGRGREAVSHPLAIDGTNAPLGNRSPSAKGDSAIRVIANRRGSVTMRGTDRRKLPRRKGVGRVTGVRPSSSASLGFPANSCRNTTGHLHQWRPSCRAVRRSVSGKGQKPPGGRA